MTERLQDIDPVINSNVGKPHVSGIHLAIDHLGSPLNHGGIEGLVLIQSPQVRPGGLKGWIHLNLQLER